MTPAVRIAHILNMTFFVGPIFCACLIIFFGIMNLEVIKSKPPLECLHCLFVCNLFIKQVSFLYIPTLHNDCSHIDNVYH